jgi:hypothetical protein
VYVVLHLIGKGPLDRHLLAASVGLVTTWGLIGLTRQTQGIDQPRYIYVGAVFVLLIAASLLGSLRRTPSGIRYGATALGLAAVALTTNVVALGDGVQEAYSWHDRGRATLDLLLRYGGTPAVPDVKGPQDVYYPPTLPGPARLRELVATYGSPLEDTISGVRPIPTWALDAMLFEIVKPRIIDDLASRLPTSTSPAIIVDQADVDSAPEGGCERFTPSGGSPRLTLSLPPGERLYVQSDVAQDLVHTVSRFGVFHPIASRTASLPAGVPWEIELPDLGDVAAWMVRLEPGGAGSLLACMG